MAIITDPDELEQKPVWTEWERTFCFLPRKDIRGVHIIGPAWYRMQEARVLEYENDVGYYMSSSCGWIEYSRNKKDIFLRSLNGEKDG